MRPKLAVIKQIKNKTQMKMKTINKSCAVVAAVSAMNASSLFAGPIGAGSVYMTAPGYSAPPYTDRGPYTAATVTTLTGPALGTFGTFCLGVNIDFSPNTTYNYQLSTSIEALAGGDSHGYGYVSLGTAWFYSQYLARTLPGIGSVNNLTTDALQEAIWTLQGQGADYTAKTGTTPNLFLADVWSQFNSSETNNANGEYDVYALNLTDNNGHYVQPQLAQVPDSTSLLAEVLLVVPFAAGAMIITRRNKGSLI
jgi:hypothetical protein